jgi:hypothetical protein
MREMRREEERRKKASRAAYFKKTTTAYKQSDKVKEIDLELTAAG